MARVLIVDWLGRGGIAQTTDEWARAVRRAGHEPLIVTRKGRPLASTTSGEVLAVGGRNRFIDEVSVTRAAMHALRTLAPSALVLQNYVVPELERRVLVAARRSGVRSVLVAHEPAVPWRPRLRRMALRSEVRAANVVVCHTRYVAGRVQQLGPRRSVVIIPLPVVGSLVELAGTEPSLLPDDPRPTALLFGHLHRRYKGGDRFVELAAAGVPGWRLAAVGRDAPSGEGLVTVDRFLSDAELASTVARCAVTLLPYDRAAQSAAVSLAQSLGSVVVTTSVGGLTEQVTPETGVLLPPTAAPAEWRDALLGLTPERLAALSAAARRETERRRELFDEGVRTTLFGG